MFASVMRGHEKGVDTFIDLCEWCENAGIPYLTVYAFSTENWKRSQQEVADLFKLMRRFFVDEIHRCVEKGVRVVVIGNLSPLSAEDRKIIRDAEELEAALIRTEGFSQELIGDPPKVKNHFG